MCQASFSPLSPTEVEFAYSYGIALECRLVHDHINTIATSAENIHRAPASCHHCEHCYGRGRRSVGRARPVNPAEDCPFRPPLGPDWHHLQQARRCDFQTWQGMRCGSGSGSCCGETLTCEMQATLRLCHGRHHPSIACQCTSLGCWPRRRSTHLPLEMVKNWLGPRSHCPHLDLERLDAERERDE